MAESLHMLVQGLSKSRNEGNNKGKTMIGYSVSTYQGVLKDLKAAKEVVQMQGAGGGGSGDGFTSNPTGGLITRQYSAFSAHRYDSNDAVDSNGFYTNNGKKIYQAKAKLMDYMSFIVDQTAEGTKKCRPCVIDKIDSSTVCMLGNVQPSKMTSDAMDGHINALGQGNDFVIGCGLDMANFIVPYFNHFFGGASGNIWTDSILGKIIVAKALYAELLVGNAGSSANVIHMMVTSNIPSTKDAEYKVWIPYPILLLNDYASLAQVNIGTERVGGGTYTNPLSSSRYLHTQGKIYDFSPDYVKRMCKFDAPIGDVTCSLGSNFKDCRLRLFIDKSKAKDVPAQVSGDEELYKGTVNVIMKETIAANTSLTSEQMIMPKSKFGVMVDAGHSDRLGTLANPGTEGCGRYFAPVTGPKWQTFPEGTTIFNNEHDINVFYAKLVCAAFKSVGVQAYFVDFPQDSNKTDINKTKSAAQAAAAKGEIQAFVSIHHNAGGGWGSQCIYGKPHHPQGKKLCEYVGNRLKTTTGSIRTAAYSRSIGVLNTSEYPAIITEAGFFDNTKDLERLLTVQYAETLSKSIANGVIQWYNNEIHRG